MSDTGKSAKSPDSTANRELSDDRPYEVGYCKPPRGKLFEPGQSGNPSGRPKGLTTLLNEALEADDFDAARKLIRATIINAARGNGTALKLIWDRAEGQVKQEVEMTTNVNAMTPEQKQAEIETILAAIEANKPK